LEKNNHLIVAFEEAIGALNSTINKDKDSIQSAILALEIYTYYKTKNMTLIDIFEKEIFPTYGHWFGRTVSVKIESLDWEKQIAKKMKAFSEYKKDEILSRKIKKIQYNDINEC
jgi:phosphomannomutase